VGLAGREVVILGAFGVLAGEGEEEGVSCLLEDMEMEIRRVELTVTVTVDGPYATSNTCAIPASSLPARLKLFTR
jgi:hypothetical protein